MAVARARYLVLQSPCLDLRHTAVHEQFDAIYIATVIRRQKNDCFADFVWCSRTAQGRGGRGLRLKLLDLLVAHTEFRLVAGRNHGAGADNVYADLTILQIDAPRAAKDRKAVLLAA